MIPGIIHEANDSYESLAQLDTQLVSELLHKHTELATVNSPFDYL